MPSWLNTILLSLATTIATGWLILPRLEARNRQIQDAHKTREAFSGAVLAILICTSRLENTTIPQDATPAVRSGLEAERERWRQELDTATRGLIDSSAPLTFPLAARTAAVAYAVHARGVWLSERSEEDKLALLSKLSGDAQTLLFTAWWRRPRRLRALKALLELGSEEQPSQDPPARAPLSGPAPEPS
ncbi:hypothetical protein AB0M28_14200 [Streptomyces sp. NPDC051940]|uniref:hypothetical protein n=1 Tax=Streptomyces sp. NPDC051940 TaxID=3155675 RepID=UPI0034396DCA